MGVSKSRRHGSFLTLMCMSDLVLSWIGMSNVMVVLCSTSDDAIVQFLIDKFRARVMSNRGVPVPKNKTEEKLQMERWFRANSV